MLRFNTSRSILLRFKLRGYQLYRIAVGVKFWYNMAGMFNLWINAF